MNFMSIDQNLRLGNFPMRCRTFSYEYFPFFLGVFSIFPMDSSTRIWLDFAVRNQIRLTT